MQRSWQGGGKVAKGVSVPIWALLKRVFLKIIPIKNKKDLEM